MRVGLFRPVAPEVIAVGYTFEHEIFERLLERAPTSKHEFVVFEDLDGDKATGKTPNLKKTPRKRPFSAKQLYAKLRSISRTANSVPRPTYRLENEWISNSLVRERIDFFVNVSPEIAILDVPFLVIVWDLQHRLQPFFPEVDSGDEWQRRENFFSQVLKRAAYVVTATDTGKKEVQMFYGIPDERIRILPHPTPRFALEEGVYAALNRGMELASGEFLLIATCDDTMHADFLATLLEAFAICPEAGIAACDVSLINRDGGQLTREDMASYLPGRIAR